MWNLNQEISILYVNNFRNDVKYHKLPLLLFSKNCFKDVWGKLTLQYQLNVFAVVKTIYRN